MDHMTAKVSCFARAFHIRVNTVPIFADDAAFLLLGNSYAEISAHMMQGIGFFLAGFQGSDEEGLRLIVDRQLSPSVLGRSAFCEEMLSNAQKEGCRQYVLLASGYDTFGIRNKDTSLAVYELDLPSLLKEKELAVKEAGLKSCSIPVPCDLSDPSWKERLIEHGFQTDSAAFVSLLGISYYLSKDAFAALLYALASILSPGSLLCMDYPTRGEGKESRVNRQLAAGAGEVMQDLYTEEEMAQLLKQCGFACRKTLNPTEMSEQYFSAYNQANPDHVIKAPDGVSYLLAERIKE